MRISDFLQLLLLSALWGSSFLFIRVAVPVLGPIWLIQFQVLLAGLVFLPVLIQLGLLYQIRRNLIPLIVTGCINSAAPYAQKKFAGVSSLVVVIMRGIKSNK